MKSVKVVAAVIERDGRILATQRATGAFAGGWEFPGGKVERDETLEQALHREIREELDARIEVGELIVEVEHAYDDFLLELSCFHCRLLDEDVRLLEHCDARWLGARDVRSVAWLPADVAAIDAVVAAGIVA